MMISLLKNPKKSNGVHPPGNKSTKGLKAAKAPLPKIVTIPLSQHIGAPAKALVKKGDEVKTAQKIAEPGGFVSAAIHSPISGKVSKIVQSVGTNGAVVDTIIIEADGDDEWVELTAHEDPSELKDEQIVEIVKDAGIVGMGGATFPTHVKLMPPKDKKLDSIIVNGCECEPFITTDHRLMIERADEVLKGLALSMRILKIDRAYIGIEDNKPDAIIHLRKRILELDLPGEITVEQLPAQYPMGAEKTLLKRILGREVPIGGLPMDVGVVVQNVATLNAMYDAVYEGIPLIERMVTVTGLVKEQKNMVCRLGMSAQEVIDHCGGAKRGANTVVFGGPMMGVAQATTDAPLTKGTNCVLLRKDERRPETNCIRCGKCVEACPMDLMPMMFVAYVKRDIYEGLDTDYYINSCVECGSCAYGCPASIPIVQYIKTGKSELRKRGSE